MSHILGILTKFSKYHPWMLMLVHVYPGSRYTVLAFASLPDLKGLDVCSGIVRYVYPNHTQISGTNVCYIYR